MTTETPSQPTGTTPSFPPDYDERVYAGLLGKAIGVYLGRPIEGWSYEEITARLGEVDRYVSAELGKPLVLTDDDIAGTVTFIRAVEDSGRGYDTTADDVADAWLNYLIEHRSVLWWGGMGNSTEHTAYLRLRQGHRPPRSGSAELNGRVVAEQIGAQIFADGWAMIAPGAPALAAELAERAAIVSHDGEAVLAARVLAAMESAAFHTKDPDELVDAGLAIIPPESLVATMIGDLRAWRAAGLDWRAARDRLDERYGYDSYGGNCHVIPNHGLIVLALLWGEGDFSRSLMIVNTCGWDTDCNSGNLGALLGIALGLDGIDHSWREPVADRIYAPTADAGSGITDIAREARRIAALGRSAAGLPSTDGPRFDFRFPGSVQGFAALDGDPGSVVRHVRTSGGVPGIAVDTGGDRAVLATPTFVLPHEQDMGAYQLDVAPTLYPGQALRYTVVVDGGPATVTPQVRHYASGDTLVPLSGPAHQLEPGIHEIGWTVPPTDGEPVTLAGLVVEPASRVVLTALDWSGAPDVVFDRPARPSAVWRRAWVSTMDYNHHAPPETFRLVANGERRLLITGTRDWADYRAEATLTPHMGDAMGLAVRVQGLERYLLVELSRARGLRILRRRDGADELLATAPFHWRDGEPVRVGAAVSGTEVTAVLGGVPVATAATDLPSGGIALAAQTARVAVGRVTVSPL